MMLMKIHIIRLLEDDIENAILCLPEEALGVIIDVILMRLGSG